jgi:hypothetical protein
MGDGIVRKANALDEQSTFQMALIAFRPSCPLGF